MPQLICDFFVCRYFKIVLQIVNTNFQSYRKIFLKIIIYKKKFLLLRINKV